ncbi:prephenate dehydrogenase [Micromonospora sp. NPDC003197]
MLDPGVRETRVAVVGTGLIGGSILLRLQEAGLDVRGWDPDPSTRDFARQQGLTFAETLTDAVRDRDVVFLGGPLSSLPDTLVKVAKMTDDRCVITDVGSTKSGVAAYAVETGLAHRFVPGHPMAGTERAGLTAAIPALFDGAAWVLCPSPDGLISQFRTLAQLFIEVFAARIVPMDPAVHDAVVALSSHIPHLLAGSLAGAAARSPVSEAILGLAAGSFRDGTRVAGTPSRRTADMLINNRHFVLRQMELVDAFLADLTAALRADDVEALTTHLTQSRDLRESLLSRPMTRSVEQFPVSGPDSAELDFLLRLGETGGHLTRCAIDSAMVSYTAFQPA